MPGRSVFFTGATGYIGGTVLTSILSSANPPAKVTALIRDPKKAELFPTLSLAKEKGVELVALVGSLDDADKLQAAAAEADVVVSTADADHLPSIQAILAGLKARKEKTGHRPLLIHTSGTGVFADEAKGEYPTDVIYTDLHPTPATKNSPALISMAKLPATAQHRHVDLAIVAADAAGVIKSYIVLPSTIWGFGQGEVFEKGFSHATSIQIPQLIEASIDRQRAGVVGKGANIWPHVAITDLAALYNLVWSKATVPAPTIGHGTSGYYLGIAGEYTLFGAASTIGQSLVKHKIVPDGTETTPTPFTKEEIDKYYGGASSRAVTRGGVADRSKSIGWKPKYTDEENFFADIDLEVQRIAKARQ